MSAILTEIPTVSFHQLCKLDEPVWDFAISPNRDYLAILSKSNLLFRCIDFDWMSFSKNGGYCGGVAWSPKGDKVAVGTNDGHIFIIDARNAIYTECVNASCILNVIMANYGEPIHQDIPIFTDPTIIDPDSTHEWISGIYWIDDNTVAVSSSSREPIYEFMYVDGSVSIWDVRDNTKPKYRIGTGDVIDITSNDRHEIICVSKSIDPPMRVNETRLVRIDLKTGNSSEIYIDCDGYYELMRIDKHGDFLAVPRWGGQIFIYRTGDFKKISTLENREAVTSLCFSSDGSKIITGGSYGSIRLFDVRSGKLIWTIRRDRQSIKHLKWLLDDKAIVLVYKDDNVYFIEDVTSHRKVFP